MTSNLIKIFKNINRTSCPNDMNFHCHTTCSDGSLTPIELFKLANNNNLQHLSITDHHSIHAFIEIEEWKKKNALSTELPKLWTGIEISCLLNKCLVHVLGFDFDIHHSSISPYIRGESQTGKLLNSTSVVEAIHKSGGLVILAHPARYRIHFRDLIKTANLQNFDGAEAWYDYEFSNKWSPTPLVCESIDTQLKNLGMLSTCGTDSHGLSLNSR